MRSITDVGLLALVATLISSPIALSWLNRRHILDEPSGRSAHSVPVPRGGGLACLIGLAIAIATASHLGTNSKLLFLSAGVTFAALGFGDDVLGFSIRSRLIGQVVLASGISFWALHHSYQSAFFPLACAIGAIWIVAYVNIFNFMDGMNGLAGSAAAIAGVTFAFIGYDRDQVTLAIGGAALAGTAVGFLPWNFPNARVFLGDVGSYLLGSWTALLVLVGFRAHVPWECLLGPVALFITDAGWTLGLRIARNEDWTASHKQHVYQQLHQRGWSHARTTSYVSLLMVACAALGTLSLTDSLGTRIAGDGLIVLLLAFYLATPTLFSQLKDAR